MRALAFFTLVLSFGPPLSAQQTADPYEKRVGEDFVEKTVFRFRTKFYREYTEEEFKSIISRRTDVPPILDGVMEDDCWKTADHTKSAWVQWVNKQVSRKQTVVYACHDDKNLYMAIVCEEPSLKAVLMPSRHPGGTRSWKTAGDGDSIETFIEMGGVGGTGQVFQFIFNIYQEVAYDGLFPPYVPFIGTGYRLKGAMGGKRWIVELAFPYDGFNAEKWVNYRYEGPPRRGEIWGLRFVRNGPRTESGEERMASNWTYNPTISNHIPFPTGIVVFEDRNALYNGKLNELDPATGQPLHWRTSQAGEQAKGELRFDDQAGHAVLQATLAKDTDGFQAAQKYGVLPNVGYRLKARMKKLDGEGTVSVVIDKPWIKYDFTKVGEWETYEEDFFSNPDQREATFFISVTGASASVAIDEVSLEQQIYGAPKGAKCLTGNSPREDLNIAADALKDMKYTYLNPITGEERFPFQQSWGAGWTNGAADPGGTSGWIPFPKGSLTSPALLRDLVYWSHPRPTAGWRPYPEGHDIVFDLGKEYFVRVVEMLPTESIDNMHVLVKEEKGERFLISRKLAGAGVLHPRSPVLFGRLERVDSVVRYVKLWFGGAQGLYFVRIWGEEKGERTGISRFRWKEGLVVPEKKYFQFRKLEGPVLMPTPQEVEWGNGEFVAKDGVPVYFRKESRSASTAHHLREEVLAAFNVRLDLREEKGDEPPEAARGTIVLGEAAAGGLASRLAEQRKWQIDSKRPGCQGYFLSSTPDGILICGYDQAGTFYGVQTLLQLLVRKDFTSAAAKSVEIRDWPYIPHRIIEFRNPGEPTQAFVRAFARLKGNALGNHGRGDTAKMCDDFFIFPGWNYCGHQGDSPLEMEDDENYLHLAGPMGYARVNCCPSHLQRYEAYQRHARGTAGFDYEGINLGLDEMDLWRGGARWNSDRRCLTRQMTGDQLFTEMILRAYDLFRLHETRTALFDTMMMSSEQGGNGSYHDMYKAFGRIPEDIHVCSWKGLVNQPDCNPAEALRRFERVTLLQGGFPFLGRGKVNEYYGAPPGKGVWGHWSTVWGIAGPTDQVLAGQFCRPMTSVDGGCAIPFLCQAWNPDSPPIHTEEWALKIGHLQQRLAEIAMERELPSWRDGVAKEFFKVDMRPSCNWSHIDPLPGDDKDWLDWGPNNDLRRMPRGDVAFEEVPFHVVDPATNGGKSIVMVAGKADGALAKLPRRSADIAVGRTAASLVFLRTNVEGGYLPGYRITYEGDRYLTVPLDAMGNGSSGYACYGLYGPDQASPAPRPDDIHQNAKALYHRMVGYYSIFFRLAWLGTTEAGDPVKITMHEWVNPYPERVIKSVSVLCPEGRGSGRIEALFAITGVAPTPRDLDLWKGVQRHPLVPVNEVEIEPADTPVIPEDGQWVVKEGEDAKFQNPALFYNYADSKEDPVCSVRGFTTGDYHEWTNNRNLFKKKDNVWLGEGGLLKLEKPQVCKKIALRGQFFWEFHGKRVTYGVTSFRRTDYVLEISPDGNQWTKVAEREGICGEDGDQVHRLPATPFQYVRVRFSGKEKYETVRSYAYSYGPGLTWIQLYR
jgi:hypothetical protein